MKDVTLQNLKTELGGKTPVVIYGAGYNGKLIFEQLTDINVVGFYDDDVTRWNETYCGLPILDYTTLEKKAKKVNIIIACMYIGQILEKIKNLQFKEVYIVMDWLMQKDTEDFQFCKYKDAGTMAKLDKLMGYFEQRDALSYSYFKFIKETINEGIANKGIANLYSGEKQYFLRMFHGRLNGMNFVDCGAYTGDTVNELLEFQVEPAEVHCFEADKRNYDRLLCNTKITDRIERIHFENKALWEYETVLGMKLQNYNARIDPEGVGIQTVTIDNYFKDLRVDFVKMDIEGAELHALKGGMNVIKRDRPILAISIYHSCEDIVNIPIFLLDQLDDYSFLVRHHSFTYSESILYGIPKEKYSLWNNNEIEA